MGFTPKFTFVRACLLIGTNYEPNVSKISQADGLVFLSIVILNPIDVVTLVFDVRGMNLKVLGGQSLLERSEEKVSKVNKEF